ncbi:50S ribosomal protein L1 [Candidatus Uhrbacteria bacterium RIFCSPHIGHO2_02_FULL_57_19]|uniref:Large ribosomal subunit protein uL1 n=1 Tax=Candidatus Uhrbacteria bacterium RIFCSPHIGHO2_02_FULL_57_19 TaxID=1802391 RepID=A0A1F7U911_9BACT|nr:MAG: 50S ribosomal protein L1 [Candidatus Uhrbacteria bacterium RIFCSPHIGHO2_02_FULL_57_19]
MPHGKKYLEAKKLIDPKKVYSPEEAVELVKKTNPAKFDASVEIHIRLGIDPTKGEQQVRGTVALPHGTGKSKRVAAFVPADKEKEARDAGADLVGGEELVAEIAKTQKIGFDVAVATPDMMPKLAKVAKILGPKGLMPNPKSETVGANVKKMVEELKKGKIAFKNDDSGNVHIVIGKVSAESSKLLENLNAVTDVIKRARPASAKGIFIENAALTSSMGPSIRIQIS